MRAAGATRISRLCCVLAAAVRTSTAAAQIDTEVARRALISQAEAARDSGDHTRAAELAAGAARLRMTPSLALMLAQEHAELGHAGLALTHARQCVNDATADRALRNRDRILRLCDTLVRELSVRVEAAAAPIATPPAEPPRSAEPPPSRPQLVVAAPRQAPSEPPPPRARIGAGPWVVAGLGAAAFATAGVMWALHDGAVSERDAACDSRGCDPSSINANDRAHTFTAATNLSLALGGAALGASLLWFVISQTSATHTRPARSSMWVAPGAASLTLGGSL